MIAPPGAKVRDPQLDYWTESVSIAMQEAGISFTPEQARQVGAGIQGSHDNYGMAFYSPPASDRISAVENEWKQRVDRIQKELDTYRANAEKAVKRIAKLPSFASVSINQYGEVIRHD
jgi:hypothetical protein